MITLFKLFHFLSNPLVIGVVGILASVGAYEGGKLVGHKQGVESQKLAQTAADAQASDEIRERVKDALNEIGAGSDDADVDRVLRGLAGNAAAGD